jgi:glucose/arabinose dehydrogenase
MYATAPAGDARLFVAERAGLVRVVDETGALLPQPFLDIRSLVSTAGEGGLLGLAFAPDYAQTGQLYVYFVNAAGDSELDRFVVSAADSDRVDPASRRTVMVVDQPAGRTNHKGGTIAFSPVDGMLYWGLGDGGGANDPDNLAQNPQSLLGKFLRLDVGGGPNSTYSIPPDNPFVGNDGVRDEIWSFGWRNPFRWSFDRATGELWIGDVGQGGREEIDREAAGDGGRNYGWKVHEGTLCHLPQPGLPCESPSNPARFTFPVHEYATHTNGTCAVTGGVVYRGSVPFLQGAYVFGDYCSSRVWMLGPVGLLDVTDELAPEQGTIAGPVAFGEDGFGDVVIVSLDSGSVHRVE